MFLIIEIPRSRGGTASTGFSSAHLFVAKTVLFKAAATMKSMGTIPPQIRQARENFPRSCFLYHAVPAADAARCITCTLLEFVS